MPASGVVSTSGFIKPNLDAGLSYLLGSDSDM
jgi:hypothetical protein